MLFRRLLPSIFKTLSFRPFGAFAAVKKPLSPHDIPIKTYTELGWAFASCHNCKMMADIMKSNLAQMSDFQLSFAMYWIYNYDLELDEHFYNTIIPIVKEYLKSMGRESNRTFAEIVSYMGWLRVEDDGLWVLIEQKLITEKLYRYISLDHLVDVASGISTANRGSPALFEVLEKVFIKHRLALNGDKPEVIRKAFADRKLGSNLLFKVLENPREELGTTEEQKKALGHASH